MAASCTRMLTAAPPAHTAAHSLTVAPAHVLDPLSAHPKNRFSLRPTFRYAPVQGAAGPMFPFDNPWANLEYDEYGAAIDPQEFDLAAQSNGGNAPLPGWCRAGEHSTDAQRCGDALRGVCIG